MCALSNCFLGNSSTPFGFVAKLRHWQSTSLSLLIASMKTLPATYFLISLLLLTSNYLTEADDDTNADDEATAVADNSSNNRKARRSITTASDYAKAFEHGVRVRQEGSCQQPHPTVVYVNKTDPSKVYLPRGTVLHRCSEQTGCCQNPAETCVASEMQSVELYFITIQLQVSNQHHHHHQQRRGRVRQSPKVEKIFFTNHTMCSCRRAPSLASEEANFESLNEI